MTPGIDVGRAVALITAQLGDEVQVQQDVALDGDIADLIGGLCFLVHRVLIHLEHFTGEPAATFLQGIARNAAASAEP